MQITVRNSFCKVSGGTLEQVQAIKDLLTYENDIGPEMSRLFFQLSQARRFGNIKQERMIKGRMKHLNDGKVVCWYRDNGFPTGHLNLVFDCLQQMEAGFSVKDDRIVPEQNAFLRWYNKPPPLRYYQEEALEAALKEGRGVIEASVGSGKTLIMAHIIKNLDVTSLVVVPSRGLMDQTGVELTRLFGPRMVQQIDAKAVRSGKKLKSIRIVTLQSMAALKKSGDLERLIGDVDAIYADEAHHWGAGGATDMFSDLNHIYYRFAFSGTYTRNDNKILDLWAFLSNTLYEYPAWKAIEDGYLTPMEVLVHKVGGVPNKSYQKEYDNCYCGNPELLRKIESIIAAADPKDQILILVNKKEKSGELIHEFLNTLGIPNGYISGDNKKEEISAAIAEFNAKNLRILVGSSVLGEGIDIRASDHLINCKGGKSEIMLVQAVGRLIRLYEGKTLGILHDFDFGPAKFMARHLENRVKSYADNFRCPVHFVDS